MCVCVCVCVYIYIYIYTHTFVYIYIYIYMFVYIYSYTHLHIYMYMYTCVCNIYAPMFMYVYIEERQKRNLKAFENIVAIFKINSINFVFFLICRASSFCSCSLSILCAIIVVISIRIFRNLDLGIEWFLR